jgi:hypothetical protein
MEKKKTFIADVPVTYILRGKETYLSRAELMACSREKTKNAAFFYY